MSLTTLNLPAQDQIADLVHEAMILARASRRDRQGDAVAISKRPEHTGKEGESPLEEREHPGAFIVTGRELDLAIGGPGFFVLQTKRGRTLLTRHGRFHLDAKGYPVCANGHLLRPPASIPEGTLALRISPYGDMIATLKDGAREYLGTLELATVPMPQRMKVVDNALYEPTWQSGVPVFGSPGEHGFGLIAQGGYEALASEKRRQHVKRHSALEVEGNSRVIRLSAMRARSTGGLPQPGLDETDATNEQKALERTQLASLVQTMQKKRAANQPKRHPLSRELRAQLAARRLRTDALARVLHTMRRFQMPRFSAVAGGISDEELSQKGAFRSQEISLARRRAAEQWERRRKGA